MIDQHVPSRAPDNQTNGAGKPLQGPSWRRGVYKGETIRFADGLWVVDKIRQNGRVIYWRNASDGRVASTEAALTHPDYPRDPTPKQLKADKDADDYEVIAADFLAGTYD